eukprot:13562236-Alexandrium_andersonii.AAC.1
MVHRSVGSRVHAGRRARAARAATDEETGRGRAMSQPERIAVVSAQPCRGAPLAASPSRTSARKRRASCGRRCR